MTYTRHELLEKDRIQKQNPKVYRFNTTFKRICQTNGEIETLNIPKKSFTINPLRDVHIDLKANCYNEPLAIYPGNEEIMSVTSHVSDSIWYSITKKPPYSGGAKNDLERLGYPGKDYIFQKQKRPRSLEEIKKMLREKGLLKESMDKEGKT